MPYQTTSAGQSHPLDAELPAIEGEHAGIPGGSTEAHVAAEAARVADLPVVGTPIDYLAYNPEPDLREHDTDTSGLHRMEYPRHGLSAQENMDGEGPERLIPGGITNAHPDFSVDADGTAGPPVGEVSATEPEPEVAPEPPADDVGPEDPPLDEPEPAAGGEVPLEETNPAGLPTEPEGAPDTAPADGE